MKGMRPAIIIGIIVLMAVGWYSLSEDNKKKELEYQTTLKEARTKAQMGIYVDANLAYDTAISMKESKNLMCEIADYYVESNQDKLFIKACLDIIKKYPKDEAGYRRLVEYYYYAEDFKNCYVYINQASKRQVQSETIDKVHEKIYYTYHTKRVDLEQVDILFDRLFLVQSKDGYWGYYNERGDQAIGCIYRKVAPFSLEEFAWVSNRNDESYLINKNNEKKYVDVEDKNIEECSALSSGLMAAKIDGRYNYVNKNFEIVFGDFDYASAFHNEMAAIKEAEQWYFINASNERVSEKNYKDVKLDGAQKAFRNSLAFVSDDGKGYYLTNASGQQIGENVWDDAQLFITNEPTAVKKDGKWGFVDIEGNVVVEPQYQDARPFRSGFAPVQIGEKWGYISLEEYELVIPAIYDEVKEMSSLGNTFIREDQQWYKLSLYRYNYE